MSDWHVYPQRDLIEHETDGEDCPCVPTVEPVEREDGSFAWLHKHHSLDGREQRERAARNRTTGASGALDAPEGAEKSQEVTTTDDR